ncbi:MAG: siderophore-interacting protein [Myxococcota bacterium]
MTARHQATITKVRTLSPRLRGLTMTSPSWIGAPFSAGNKVKIDVGSGRYRSYTPAWFDAANGQMEVVAVVHGHGPGSRWAAGSSAGDVTTVFGPVPSLRGPEGDEAWAWFVGDETTVGLFRALADALPPGAKLGGAIELEEDDAVALAALDLPLRPAVRRGSHGDALGGWLATASLPPGPGRVWLSGHAGAVEAARRGLMGRGLDPQQIRAKPYWNRKKDRLRGLVGLG